MPIALKITCCANSNDETNDSSDHDNQNFVDRLNQTVGLGIIRSRAIMAQTKLACKFGHHDVLNRKHLTVVAFSDRNNTIFE